MTPAPPSSAITESCDLMLATASCRMSASASPTKLVMATQTEENTAPSPRAARSSSSRASSPKSPAPRSSIASKPNSRAECHFSPIVSPGSRCSWQESFMIPLEAARDVAARPRKAVQQVSRRSALTPGELVEKTGVEPASPVKYPSGRRQIKEHCAVPNHCRDSRAEDDHLPMPLHPPQRIDRIADGLDELGGSNGSPEVEPFQQ